MFNYLADKNMFLSKGDIKILDNRKNEYLFSEIYIDEKKRKIASNIWHNYERILSILEPGNINILNFFKNISKKKKNQKNPFLKWNNIKKKPEIVIFEGWCVGAKPESKSSLKKPTIS